MVYPPVPWRAGAPGYCPAGGAGSARREPAQCVQHALTEGLLNKNMQE